MKLTVIGCFGPYAAAGGACSSYLLEAGGKRLLLDMGAGSFSGLQRYIDPITLDGVVLTHLHHDHSSDIHTYKYYLELQKKQGRLLAPPVCYMPAAPEEVATLIKKDALFQIKYVEADMCVNIGDIELVFRKMRHPVSCYGVDIRCRGKRLFYTGDTNEFAELGSYIEGADMLIIDGGLLPPAGGESAPHLTANVAADYSKFVKRTIVTHHCPANSEEAINAHIGHKAQVAHIGDEYII